MKGLVFKGMVLALAVFALALPGCINVHDHDDDVDSCINCLAPAPVPVSEWVPFGSGSNYLTAGDVCVAPLPGPGWYDEAVSYDTIYLDGYNDYYLMDLNFNYVLTNWGNYTTTVYVSLCDYLGCEDVVYTNLQPGEQIWDRAPNPVLDSVMADFNDCYNLYGDACTLAYDIDVYVGEEEVCTPVSLDYYYEGLYVY